MSDHTRRLQVRSESQPMPKMSTFAFVGPSTRTSVAKDISTAFIQECKKGQEDSSNVPEEAEDPEDPKDPKNIPPPEQLDRLQLFLLCIIITKSSSILPTVCTMAAPLQPVTVSAPMVEGTGLDD